MVEEKELTEEMERVEKEEKKKVLNSWPSQEKTVRGPQKSSTEMEGLKGQGETPESLGGKPSALGDPNMEKKQGFFLQQGQPGKGAPLPNRFLQICEKSESEPENRRQKA